MPRRIDWLYHRKHCISCERARGFLEANGISVHSQTDAVKERRGGQEALELARSVSRIVVARGKKVVTFDMKTAPPDEQTLLSHLLGPTGNLRAPTLRKGTLLLVGFNEDAYSEALGGYTERGRE